MLLLSSLDALLPLKLFPVSASLLDSVSLCFTLQVFLYSQHSWFGISEDKWAKKVTAVEPACAQKIQLSAAKDHVLLQLRKHTHSKVKNLILYPKHLMPMEPKNSSMRNSRIGQHPNTELSLFWQFGLFTQLLVSGLPQRSKLNSNPLISLVKVPMSKTSSTDKRTILRVVCPPLSIPSLVKTIFLLTKNRLFSNSSTTM